MTDYQEYYVPSQSKWPIITACSLVIFAIGIASALQGRIFGPYVLALGFAGIIGILFGWFNEVISESKQGLYSKQMDMSFRLGMLWFIASEVMFFLGFFGALFYMRNFSVPWLGGASNNFWTHKLFYPDFTAQWPLLNLPKIGNFTQATDYMHAFGMPQQAGFINFLLGNLPAINTFILISSSVTVTYAHYALKDGRNQMVVKWLAVTILLGISFLCLQAYEYHHAYTELNLRLSSGAYGTTFFLLTGFHGLHVTIGTIMLIVMLVRAYNGSFTPRAHFAFEASSWYWHFVDVVWICLFIYVYVLPLK